MGRASIVTEALRRTVREYAGVEELGEIADV
jgi:hypothetical protein